METPLRARRGRNPFLHIALLSCVLLAIAAQLGTLRSDLVASYLGVSGPGLAWLQVGADLLTVCACGCACFILARLTWIMRRQGIFRTAAASLMFVLGIAGAKRLLDLVSPGLTGTRSMGPQMALGSIVLASGVLLLLPLLNKVREFGTAAEIAQDRFVSAAESGRQAFFILESERGSFNKILDFRFVFVNANAEKLLLHRKKDLVGRRLTQVLPTLPDASLLERLSQVERTGLPYSGEVRYRSDRGDELSLDLRAVKMQSGVAVTLHDLSAERSGQRQAEQAHQFSQALIQDAPFAIIATDPAGIITAINAAAERLTQFHREAVVGHASLVDLHDPEELRERVMGSASRDPSVGALSFDALVNLLGHRSSGEDAWHFVTAEGSRVPVHVALTTLRGDSGEITGYLATIYDISERKKLTDSITFLAQHDALTGLPNRMKLRQRLEQALERARRFNQPVAVVSIGLDNFKRVNDSLGHSAGDDLLIAFAERLRSSTRHNDTVARIGGDTFVVVMPNCGSKDDATRAAGRLSGKLQNALQLAGKELSVTASLGLALFPEWGQDAASLLRHADAAMYAAKRSGRNCLQLFSEALMESAADELELESDLRRSLIGDQMTLFYQPQVCCSTGELRGVEALVRWRHPQRGLLTPEEFISAAEESGFILPLGSWVLEKACEDGKALQKQLGRSITVAVNLSPRQFLQENLAELVEQALRRAELAPADLELEITEYTLMISSAETIAALSRLRALGVQIALDDFGTGFSSFKYLMEYKVDRLKVDRSFVSRCPDDSNASAIVRTVIAMAHELGMDVVAEGVETEEQQDFLVERGCNFAQGFFFGRPMPLEGLLAQAETAPDAEPLKEPSEVSSARV